MDIIWSILGFLVAMSLLVFIHEYGHYFAAKVFNIKVLQFSLGFGKPFYTKQVGETQFCLSPIPLGGFVRFVDEREGPVAPEDLSRAFNRQSVYKRFVVVAAGPLVNLVFAWIAFSLIYVSGINGLKPLFVADNKTSVVTNAIYEVNPLVDLSQAVWQIKSIDGQAIYSWQEVYQSVVRGLVRDENSLSLMLENFATQQTVEIQISLNSLDLDASQQDWLRILGFYPYQPPVPAIIDKIQPGSAAERAALGTGDQIIEMDGVTISSWQELVEVVRVNPDRKVGIKFLRNQQQFSTELELKSRMTEKGLQGSMGISVMIRPADLQPYMIQQKFSPFETIERGAEHSLNLIDMTLVMIKRMLFGEVSMNNLSGPISIAQFSGQAMQTGWISFLSLLGLLSLSLGVLNLLPIPVLDGGHLFYYLIEMIKGSPVNDSVQMIGQKIGLFLILMLTFLVIFNDVVRLYNA